MFSNYCARCARDCGLRVNAAIAALVPALDYAQQILPTLREHLPDNVYSAGFVLMAIANILLRLRDAPRRDNLLQ